MVLESGHTGSKLWALIGLSLCLLAVAGRATAQHSCSPGNTGQLCAACKPGWSRLDAPDGALNQGDCTRCPAPTNCLGGDPPVCAVGSEGQLCAVCSAGWSRIDGLAPKGPCKECGVGNWLALFVGTAGVFVLAPAAVFLASALDVESPRDLTIQVFGKISFLFGAMMVNLGWVLAVEWPAPFSWLMTVAHMLWRIAAFDFVPFLVGGCVGGTTYVTEIIGGICSVVVWLVMIIAFVAVNPFKQEKVKQRGIKMLWIVMFTNYVSLSIMILEAFVCEHKHLGPGCYDPPATGNRPGNETGQNSTVCAMPLEADYQIDCGSVEYLPLKGMAVLLVCIVCQGWPATVSTIALIQSNGAFKRSPEKLYAATAERKGDPFFDRYEFLVAGYKPALFLWTVLELMFALLVSSMLLFVNRGSPMQITVGVYIIVLAIVLAVVFRPYEDSRANGFYVGSLVAILAMMLICLGGRDDSGEWSGFPAFTGVLLCLCTIGIPAVGMQLWPRYFSNDLACVKKWQDKEKQKAIDKATGDSEEVSDMS